MENKMSQKKDAKHYKIPKFASRKVSLARQGAGKSKTLTEDEINIIVYFLISRADFGYHFDSNETLASNWRICKSKRY